jgi:hypothetical protein
MRFGRLTSSLTNVEEDSPTLDSRALVLYIQATYWPHVRIPVSVETRNAITWRIMQSPESVSFLQENLLFIIVAAFVIFIYLLMLIRKRWKKGFKHHSDKPGA